MTQSQRAEISVTTTLLCVVFVFGICNLPSAYYYFKDMEDVTEYYGLFLFSYFAISINSSVNFMIYCLISQKFRQTLIRLWNRGGNTEHSVTVELNLK